MKVSWAPQPGSQTLFLTCPVFEALLQGTRGGGKTDSLLMDFARDVGKGYGPEWRGVIFRREYKELADVVKKSKKWFKQIFPQARFKQGLADYKWVFPDGEELLFRTGKNEDDYWDYHGHEYPWLGFEELTNWSSSQFYLAMHSVCRSSHPGIPKRIRATANPYGSGHNWVKTRFIDPAPNGKIIYGEDGRPRVSIRSVIWENKILLKNDPEYLKTLESVDDIKRKAWLEGDWDIVAGGMFDDVFDSKRHVIQPFEIPKSWRIDRSFDWGSSKPFSVGWWAESDGTDAPNGKSYPRGTLFRIAEWYGWNGKPNEGCRMLATEIARGILQRESEMKLTGRVRAGPADSSIFDTQNGVCIADDMSRIGVRWERADKGPGSRKNGWEYLRKIIKASLVFPLEYPGFFVFDTCRHFVRTVPVLPRSEKDPDDVDSDAEDHVGDESRYRANMPKREVTVSPLRI